MTIKIKEKIQKFLKLRKKYCNVEDIPQKELQECGYELTTDDSGCQTAKLKKLNSNQNKISKKNNLGVKNINKKGPFKKLEIIVELNSKSAISCPSNEVYNKFESKLYVFHRKCLNDKTIFNLLPKNQSLSRLKISWDDFSQNYNKVEKKILDELINIKERIERIDLQPTSSENLGLELEVKDILNSISESDKFEEDSGEIIEIFVSQLKDHNYLEKKYLNNLSHIVNGHKELFRDFALDNSTHPNNLPNIKKFCDNKSTVEKAFIHYIGEYFQHNDLSEISKELKKNNNLYGVKKYFESFSFKNHPLLLEKIKLSNEMKNSSIDEKKNLSQKLNEIKTQIKNKKQIVGDFLEYLNGYKLISNYIYNRLDSFIGMVYDLKKTNNFPENFTIDGRYNSELDSNPGKLSGDCTTDLPLPFHEPNLHNLKVFNDKNKHKGNIYLFETTQKNSKKKVWQIEAVQIPNRRINYKDFLEKLVESLGKKCTKKDIDYITWSVHEPYRSNYDFIRNASNEVQTYGQIFIDVPKFKTKGNYSPLQCDGQVYVVWKK